MKNTQKKVALKHPRINEWISRTVWARNDDIEYVKINGTSFTIDFLRSHGWDVRYTY